MSRVLYISYDGMLEPLGQSQVLRYLEGLAVRHQIFLISFEKSEDTENKEEFERLKKHLKDKRIHWKPLKYHKTPTAIATTLDIVHGIIVGSILSIRYKIAIVHARSYVPSVMALVLKKLFGLKYIFDMRGFWADERIDGGIWLKKSNIYRIAKWFERKFLLKSDCVVSLTEAAVDEMRKFSYLQNNMPRFELISTCADLKTFRASKENKDKNKFILGYVGSVGVWYQFEEVLRCYKILLDIVPNANFHIFNRGGHAYINEMLEKYNISKKRVLIESAEHNKIANTMQTMSAGIFFYKVAYSKKATAPTKLGEFLGCGVPCLVNAGVGDMEAIIKKERVGVVLSEFSEESMIAGINELLDLLSDKQVRERCCKAAGKYFSLEDGVEAYHSIYQSFE